MRAYRSMKTDWTTAQETTTLSTAKATRAAAAVPWLCAALISVKPTPTRHPTLAPCGHRRCLLTGETDDGGPRPRQEDARRRVPPGEHRHLPGQHQR